MKFISILLMLATTSAFTYTNPPKSTRKVLTASSLTPDPQVFVPDAEKRALMNLVLVTSLFGSCGPLAAGFAYYIYSHQAGSFVLKSSPTHCLRYTFPSMFSTLAIARDLGAGPRITLPSLLY